MNRTEIEIKLSKDRAWILEHLLEMSDDELYAPRTRSEHDPEKFWSYADHFVHTTLIERDWNAMFRRHINGERGMTTEFRGEPGSPPPDMATIMQRVNAWTERWAEENRGKPLDDLVRIGMEVRSDTLKLLSELTDEQLNSKIPGAPWADGTVGGIMAANADHGRMHWGYAARGDEDLV